MLEFNLREQEVADLLGITIDTVRNWRSNGTLPDYLYRRFGPVHQPRIRYCRFLVLRWQATCSDVAARLAEEIWAREELAKSLQGSREQ